MYFELTHEQRLDLIKLIRKSFDPDELEDLIMEANFPRGNFSGSHNSQVRQIVTYAGRNVEDQKLIEALHELRGDRLDLTPFGWPFNGDGSGGAQPSGTSTTSASSNTPSQQQYENFDLRVGFKAADGRYPVEVSRSPQGESPTVWQSFPLDDYDFTDLVDYLRDLVGQSQDAVDLGKQMRDLLFPGPVWSLFTASRAVMQQQGKGLRIRLRIDPPELSSLPWEYCYDDTYRFFALQRETPMVRYISQPFRAATIAAPTPLKVLVAIAAPKDQAELNVDEEEKRLRDILGVLGSNVQLQVVRNATAEKVQGALAMQPHIFHFIGHGVFQNGKGALAFESLFGQTQLIDADQLMFLMGNTGVKVVILNACKTAATDARNAMMGVAPSLVQAQIPAVVAMQFNVPDKTALGFTRDLYRFLVAGKPLDAAVTEMRIGAYIGSSDKYFWGIPSLFMRAPDGVLWQQNPNADAILQAGAAAVVSSSDPSLANLLGIIKKEVQSLSGEIDERDMRYIMRGLDGAIELASEDSPDGRLLQRDLERVVDDLKATKSQAIADQIIPKVEFVAEKAGQLG